MCGFVFVDMWFVDSASCFFFKQKTAYEMRISDWSSDVCSSDLLVRALEVERGRPGEVGAGFEHEAVRGARIEPDVDHVAHLLIEIGRASCRERVSVRVDLGGRRIIKKKKDNKR